MEDLDFSGGERSENPNHICRERDRELRLPGDSLIRERIGEVKNPRNREGEENSSNTDEVRERKREEEEEEEREKPRSVGLIERETPPDDDCCPICFGGFNIPCKTNCGHWYCANCILMFWSYSNALERCKCPMCSRLIGKLTPEASLTLQREEEVIEALKKVQSYNHLFVGGAYGFIMKVCQLPTFFGRFFIGLMDPDRFRLNYYTARLIALLLTVFYESFGFDFIPTGSLGIRRVFEYTAIALVTILFLVGIGYRFMLRCRVRLMAAPHP